jgi:hypothetical protein
VEENNGFEDGVAKLHQFYGRSASDLRPGKMAGAFSNIA